MFCFSSYSLCSFSMPTSLIFRSETSAIRSSFWVSSDVRLSSSWKQSRTFSPVIYLHTDRVLCDLLAGLEKALPHCLMLSTQKLNDSRQKPHVLLLYNTKNAARQIWYKHLLQAEKVTTKPSMTNKFIQKLASLSLSPQRVYFELFERCVSQVLQLFSPKHSPMLIPKPLCPPP